MKYDRVQCLRFLAAAAVVLFHSVGTAGHHFAGPILFGFAAHGDYGVDLFFVISGFIMVLTTHARERDWRLFLSRRVERIVPLYWLATLAMVAMLSVHGLSSTPPPDAGYIARSLFFLSWTGDKLPLVFPGWTVEYEALFYLLIAACLALASRTWITVIAILVGATMLGALGRALGASVPGGAFLTDPMLLEFALGILVAHVVLGIRSAGPVGAIILAGLAACWIAPWAEHTWRVAVAGLPAAAIVLGATMLDRDRPLGSRLARPFVRLGDASYSIYLVQIFIISIGCKLIQRIAPSAAPDAAIVACFASTILVAWLVHLWIERPVGRLLRRLEPGRAARAKSPPLPEQPGSSATGKGC